MKKRKISYIEKIIVLFMVMLNICMGASAVLLYIVYRTETVQLLGRVLITGIFLLTLVAFIAIIRTQVIYPLKQYQTLSEKFLQGHIYSEFMDKAGNIYPGMGEVLKHIDRLLNNQHLSWESKRRSEFLALQNQINPHFLYNTLEAIRGDALAEGMDNIADITEALSTFFRYSVTDTGSLVTIADELDNIDNYFKIQQYRFGEKLELVCEIPEDETVLELMCPKLTLQPIVENAIFHGLEKKTDKGAITIRFETTSNKLLITIQDNGVGMDRETLEALNDRLMRLTMAYAGKEDNSKKGGIALINVCRRIKLLFGENYGIHVFSIPEYGTDVRITLPIVKKNLESDYERRTYRY